MTPAEFELKMQSVLTEYADDNEWAHIKMCDLMCECLKSLGYEKGIEVFERFEEGY